MPLAEAQALLGATAHFAPHDLQADRTLLQLVAGWCARYSPLVGMEEAPEPSALFFDITGCAPLFGGEERMAVQVGRDFERAGYLVRIALADTIGAAWAAVRFSRVSSHVRADGKKHALSTADGTRSVPATIIPPGGQSALLKNLPVAALRLPRDTVETLEELGIRQIGLLQDLPRKSLPARFGPCVLERLDQALGVVEELIIPVPPSEPIEADWSFEEPTADRRTLESVLKRLMGEIAETLAARQEGAQRLVCRLFCAGKEPVHLTVGALHPTALAEHLCELVHLQLERITLAGEILAVHVEVAASGPLGSQQHGFFDAGVNHEGERHLAVLVDRLSSRLGEKAVLRPRLCPDPQPEYASRLVAVLAGGREIANYKLTKGNPKSAPSENEQGRNPESFFPVPDYQFVAIAAARPLVVKPRPIPIEVISMVPDGPPVRFRWHAAEHVIEACWGPERIETGWWRGPHVERDYYRVETAAGQRFWLFRQNDTGKWFLHGAFE